MFLGLPCFTFHAMPVNVFLTSTLKKYFLVKDLHPCCTFTPTPRLLLSSFVMSFDERQLLLVTWSYLSIFCLPICLAFWRSSSSPRHHNSILLGMLQRFHVFCLSHLMFFNLLIPSSFNLPAVYIHALSLKKNSFVSSKACGEKIPPYPLPASPFTHSPIPRGCQRCKK